MLLELVVGPFNFSVLSQFTAWHIEGQNHEEDRKYHREQRESIRKPVRQVPALQFEHIDGDPTTDAYLKEGLDKESLSTLFRFDPINKQVEAELLRSASDAVLLSPKLFAATRLEEQETQLEYDEGQE